VIAIDNVRPSLLNALIMGQPCKVVSNRGRSLSGEFRGVEAIHGDWSVLVRTGRTTHSLPVGQLRFAAGPPGVRAVRARA
jgi:hypothetical protein